MDRSRWLKLLSIGLVVSITLSACASAHTPTPMPQPAATRSQPPPLPTATPRAISAREPAAPSTGETVELKITWWGSLDRHRRTLKVIQLFQQRYPHIRITSEFSGWNVYWTMLGEMAATGDLPDVMQQDYACLADWSARGLLLPLDDDATGGALNLVDVPAETLESGRVAGRLMGISLGTTSQCWVLDVDAFQRAGLALPPADWTWADFERIATTLRRKLGIWGMGSGMWSEELWGSLYLSAGSWRYSATGTELGYDDDQPLVDYLSMLLRLQKAQALIPRATELASYDVTTKGVQADPIVSRRAAMAYLGSDQVPALWQAAGESRHLKLVPLPRVAGGRSANYLKASSFWSITAGCQHPREAATFIDFFINSIEANELLMAERGVPVSARVREALRPRLDPALAQVFDFIAQVSHDAPPLPPPDPPGHADVVRYVLRPRVLDPVASGKLAPQRAALLLRQEADLILANNGR